MQITTSQQIDYISDVVDRVKRGDLERMAGVYRIDTMAELEPGLKPVADTAIKLIYEAANKEQQQ